MSEKQNKKSQPYLIFEDMSSGKMIVLPAYDFDDATIEWIENNPDRFNEILQIAQQQYKQQNAEKENDVIDL